MSDTYLFFVETGRQQGLGHLTRCIALADALRLYGAKPVVATTASLERSRWDGIELLPGKVDHADAATARALADEYLAEVIIIDGYSFGSGFQRAFSASTVACIDDYARLPSHHVDIVLDQNAGTQPGLYGDAGSARLLLGNRFALLRRDFIRYAGWQREHRPSLDRALVVVGGTDPSGLSQRVLQILSGSSPIRYVDLVLGPLAGALDSEPTPYELAVHRDPPSMADLMSRADVAISASGSIVWELAFMQLPCVVFSLADNQEPLALTVETSGMGKDLGSASDLTSEGVNAALEEISDTSTRANMGAAGRELIDGYGSERVAAKLTGSPLWFRDATESDADLLLRWANDPEVRAASFGREPIELRDHIGWLRPRLSATNVSIYIAIDLDDGPAGQIRFESEGEEATCHVSLGTSHRGKGLGAAIIQGGCRRLFAETEVRTITALVMTENGASRHSFERAGFSLDRQVTHRNADALIYTLTRK